MTLLESILTAQSIGVEEGALLICMAQHCDGTGALQGISSDKDITKMWNQRYKKRSGVSTVSSLLDSLVEKKAIPSRYQVYAPSAESSGEEIEKMVKQILLLREREEARIPRQEKNRAHYRIGFALLAAQIPEAGFIQRREAVTTPDDLYLVVNGEVIRSVEFVWDFAYVNRWIREYGEEFVVSTICRLQAQNLLSSIECENTFRAKQKAYRGYIEATLRSTGTSKTAVPTMNTQDEWR